MSDLQIFESFGIRSEGEVYASRRQICDLFEVPRKTLFDNITKLKEDGLVSGAKIRTTANDGKNYSTEVFNIQEVIKIGFRLRSEKALKLQDYAAKMLDERMKEIIKENKRLELELSFAWNKIDARDLYRKQD